LFRLSEALLYYINNMDRAPDKNVKGDYYAVELAMAFETLFTYWMETKHTQLCQCCLESVGCISQLMPPVRLVEYGPKLLHNLLGLYKSGHVPALNVTRCLSQTLGGLSAHPTFGVEMGGPVWELLLSTLFHQVSAGHDFDQPDTVQNHYEILRCYEILARNCTDRVIRNVILKLDSSHTKPRVGVFTVLRHLANALKVEFQPFTDDVNRVLKHSLSDTRNPVRHSIIQLITTLALQGQLKTDVIEDFVNYLLKLSSLDGGTAALRTSLGTITALLDGSVDGKIRIANVTNEEIRQTSENALLVMASSCYSLESYLWTEFMSLILKKDAVGIAPLVVRILAIVATRKRQTGKGAEQGMAQSMAVSVATRCFILAGIVPSHNGVHVASALEFLRDFAIYVSPDLQAQWDSKIPSLILLLRDLRTADPVERKAWRSEVLNLFEGTVDFLDQDAGSSNAKDEQSFATKFGSALESQLDFYADFPDERAFLYLLLGIITEKMDSSELAESMVDLILHAARPVFEIERQSCPEALGLVARSHLEAVLSRLHNFEKISLAQRSGGFFATFRRDSRSKLDSDMNRVMILKAYGEAAMKAPLVQLMMHADPIAVVITHVLEGSNNLEVRRSGLEAIYSVATSLVSDGVSDQCVLESEVSLIGVCLAEMAEESANDAFLVTALHALSALISLPKVLDESLRERILHRAFEAVLPTYAYLESLQLDVRAVKLLVALKDLVLYLARMKLEPKSTDILFTEILRWIDYDNAYVRNATIQVLHMSLTLMLDEWRTDLATTARVDFNGSVAALLARCFDSSPAVRNEAVASLSVVIRLSSRLQGLSINHDEDYIDKLAEIKLVLSSLDDRLFVEVGHALAKIASTQIPVGSLNLFIEYLSKSLEDPCESSSRGISIIIWSILSERGTELHLRTGDTLKMLFSKLPRVTNEKTVLYVLQGVMAMGKHNMDGVVNELLQHTLPFDENVKKCFKMMAADHSLGAKILKHLIVYLGQGQVLDDHGLPLDGKIVAHRPLATVIAVGIMATEIEFNKTLEAQFAQTFGSLLLLAGCFLDTSVAAMPPSSPSDKQDKSFFAPRKETYKLNPFTCVREAAQNVAACMNMNLTAQTMQDFESLDSSPRINTLCNRIASVARVLTVEATSYLEDIVALFSHAMKMNMEPYRVTAAPFLAEIINQSCGGLESKLLEPILLSLSSAQTDTQPIVRKWSLKGLSALSKCSRNQVDRHCAPVLNALVAGLEDDSLDNQGEKKRDRGWFKEKEQDDATACAYESLVGLSKLLPIASQTEICRLAPRLAVRVRSFFEKEDSKLRAAAFSLMGTILGCGDAAGCEESLKEAAHASLVALLLHASEPDNDVSLACIDAIGQGLRFLGLENLLSVLESMKSRSISASEHRNLLENTINVFLEEDEETLINMLSGSLVYFKSSLPELRASSVLFVGYIFRKIDKSKVANIRKKVSLGLAHLLRDADRSVRLQALAASTLIYG
ncbi:hypothetical protein QYM36_002155, partial [Artemia franciscana]